MQNKASFDGLPDLVFGSDRNYVLPYFFKQRMNATYFRFSTSYALNRVLPFTDLISHGPTSEGVIRTACWFFRRSKIKTGWYAPTLVGRMGRANALGARGATVGCARVWNIGME
jgi:hypothetical protein